MNTTHREHSLVSLLGPAFGGWLDDRSPTLAGALAFSTIFALAPLFVIIMAVTGHFVSSDLIEQHLVNQVSHAVGSDAAAALRAMVQAARQNATAGSIVGAIGWIVLAGAASGIFLTLQDALNIIWRVEVPKNQPIGKVLRERGSALAMVFVMALLIVVTLTADALIAVAATYLETHTSLTALGWLLRIAGTVLSLAVATGLFAMTFKVLPQIRIEWRDVWSGAAVSAILFVAGQWGIAFFLHVAGLTKGYGAAGSILALLMWVYMSAMFLFFGAEITKATAMRRNPERYEKGHEVPIARAASAA